MRRALAAGLAAGLVVFALAFVAPVAAQMREAPPLAEDPAVEARVMNLATVLRCLVCQNQTLADSNAELAVDLRNQLRAQVKAGRSDEEIMTTVLLWAGPFVLLLAGLAGLLMTLRRRARAQASAAGAERDAVDEAARARAKALLDEPGRGA
ncbi:MAG: cytochrome c-type biogenesis protein CcmH [bacterium]